MESSGARPLALRRIGWAVVYATGLALAQCGEPQESTARVPFVQTLPMTLRAAPWEASLVLTPRTSHTSQDPPSTGGITTGEICPVQGATVLAGVIAPVDASRPTLRVGVGRSVRGPQRTQGASVFNAVASADERCGMRVVGGCTVRDCRPPQEGIGDMGAPLRGASAGEVWVSGSRAQGPYFFAPHSNGTYPPAAGLGGPPSEVTNNDPPWNPNDVVCIQARGAGAVGEFQTRVLFPSPVTVLWPTLEDPVNQILGINRREPLRVRWEPVEETVVLSLNQRPANGTTPTWLEDLVVSCAFDGRLGEGSVPPELLAVFLSSEEGNSSGSLSVSTRRETAVAVGGVRVIASAADGISYRATFQ